MKLDIDNRYEIGDLVIIKDLDFQYSHDEPMAFCKIGIVSAIIADSTLRSANQSNPTDDMINTVIQYRINTSIADKMTFIERSITVNEGAILGKVDDITPEMMTKLRSWFPAERRLITHDTSC